MRWLDDFGAKIVFPGQAAQGVRELGGLAPCTAREAGGCGGGRCEIPFDVKGFVAVPFVEQGAAAGAGLILEEHVSEWMIVYAHSLSSLSRDLCAVRLGEQQDSMLPTLHPGDILLVDKGAVSPEMADPQPPGNMFMVREPGGGKEEGEGVAVKRVVFDREGSTTRLVFYSDNAKGHPPRIFNFDKVFGGDVRRALIGRIVWAWSDMTRK
ncbi:S24 family peptidase [Megalodesulfovibrio paquesii]